MKVTLADPLIMVDGWTPDLDRLGSYTLKERKTPAEIREERRLRQERYGDGARKVNPIRYTKKTLIQEDRDVPGRVYFLPGLWPRVKYFLDKSGIKYELEDRRNPDIRPPLDMSRLEGVEFRERQDEALQLIAGSDCGIINTSTGFGKSMLISWLCKALPTLNIVVTTSSTQVVGTLCEYLNKVLPGEVGMMMGGKDTTAGKRVVVSTLKSLGNIKPEKVHLVLVDECHNVGDNQAGQEVMKFCWARRFGFSASPIRNDGTAKVMEAILGPVIMKMDYAEATEAGMVTPMKYMMLPCTDANALCRNPDLPEVMLKRYSYWSNNQRNRAIRNFVYDLKKVYDGQILIMVGTLEHAIQLHQLLPWFVVAYYGSADMEEIRRHFPASRFPGLDLSKYKSTQKDLDRTRNAFAKGTLRYVISTKVFRQGVNFTHLQVLVRGDGDVSAIEGIQIPGRLARLDEGKDFAYLVDVDDSFSGWASARAKARERQYTAQKWQKVSYEELLNELGNRVEDGGS